MTTPPDGSRIVPRMIAAGAARRVTMDKSSPLTQAVLMPDRLFAEAALLRIVDELDTTRQTSACLVSPGRVSYTGQAVFKRISAVRTIRSC